MKKLALTTLAAVAMGTVTIATFAADDAPFAGEIKARQSFMQVYAFNLGILGRMAKGDAEYDAELASAAANNLLSAASMSNGAMWPGGSDLSATGLGDVTNAKPEMWSTYPEVVEKGKALHGALTTMAAEAGNGLDAVRSNMGAVGDGCKGCHEPYRRSED